LGSCVGRPETARFEPVNFAMEATKKL